MAGWLQNIGEFFGGTPGKVEQVNRFNPQQQQALMQLLNMGGQGLQNPYQGFDPIEKRAQSQFAQNTIPSLAERFTSMGSSGGGALSSPAFASQLGSAGAGLSEGLAALRAQYGQQQQGHFANLLGKGLTPQYENYQVQGNSGFLNNAASAVGQGLGLYASGGLGAGANMGAGILSSLLGSATGSPQIQQQPQYNMRPAMQGMQQSPFGSYYGSSLYNRLNQF